MNLNHAVLAYSRSAGRIVRVEAWDHKHKLGPKQRYWIKPGEDYYAAVERVRLEAENKDVQS